MCNEIGWQFGNSICPSHLNERLRYHDIRYHMPECDYCGGHVSEQFERVFADDDGQIRACPNCSANAGIAEVSKRRIQDA